MARADRDLLERTVRETRDDHLFYMQALGRAIAAPTVLLWCSQRIPDYRIDCSWPFGIHGHYPQLIDLETVDRIRPAFDAYVECATDIGLHQPLWRADREVAGAEPGDDGRRWNRYYPSMEMHARASDLLTRNCARPMGPNSRNKGSRARFQSGIAPTRERRRASRNEPAIGCDCALTTRLIESQFPRPCRLAGPGRQRYAVIS